MAHCMCTHTEEHHEGVWAELAKEAGAHAGGKLQQPGTLPPLEEGLTIIAHELCIWGAAGTQQVDIITKRSKLV